VGLLDNLRGNASEVDTSKAAAELQELLTPGEGIDHAYAVFRDLIVFTNKRLLIVDKQGMSGKKVEYHSVPYRAITQFNVETAGTFDADSELVIGISGGGEVRKQFGRKSNILDVQRVLAAHVLG
jgi:Bacterial PH domain